MSDSVRPPWTIAYQAPLSMEFSRQQYWSGLPFLSPGVLPDPGIEPRSPTLQVDSLPSEPPGNPRLYFGGLQNHSDGDCNHEIKRCLVLGKKSYDQPRQRVKKQRHYFANKVLSNQSYGFFSSHVWT